jgi:hypothetical protein
VTSFTLRPLKSLGNNHRFPPDRTLGEYWKLFGNNIEGENHRELNSSCPAPNRFYINGLHSYIKTIKLSVISRGGDFADVHFN